MGGNPDLLRHNLYFLQDIFPDSCLIQCFSRAKGRGVVRPTDVFWQFDVPVG